MSNKKWIYFGVLSAILIIAIIIVIRYCDFPICNNNFKLFIKPENSDMLFYNLSTGYIVSYIFYILVNFIPDCINKNEKEKELIALRCGIHHEVQGVSSIIIQLWANLAKASFEKKDVEISI